MHTLPFLDVPDVCGGPKEADAPFSDFHVQDLTALPDSVDWRTHTPAVVSPVKNQGGCGSCWAFSTVETIESNIAINTGNHILHSILCLRAHFTSSTSSTHPSYFVFFSGTLLELSPQQIVSCAANPAKCGGDGGCQGSTQWLGFNYTIGAGITDEKVCVWGSKRSTRNIPDLTKSSLIVVACFSSHSPGLSLHRHDW
jgi:hypothetical protein